jgi:3-hydroxy-9,10-secoandrosta-1,3,5(10)-triene-9,17-dione monooxygenase
MAQAETQPQVDPVALAIELRPLLERNAVRVERDRRLLTENVDALQAANLFKVMTPRRWGGYGTTLSTTLKTFAELAKGCSSTGWVTMIIAGINWWASLLPDRGQEEIFANSAGTRVCGATGSPTVVSRRADGGLRISGKFPFASGCWHSTWSGLGVQIEDDVHNVVGQVVGFVPISELEIEDTWFVAGMCGTGSNTLVAKDIFVPDHRILPTTKILNWEYPARRHSGEPSDKYAFSAANSLIGIAPVLGIAQAMLEKVIEGTRKRGITFTTYARQADSAVAQHEIAEAALQIDSAWLQVMHAAAQVEDIAAEGKPMDYVARARVRGLVGYAAKLIREAIDALASIGGASGFADSSPLQRMWRDASIATRHGLVTTDPGLEIYGRALVGPEGNISPFI